jgi:hypothetical protein
MTLSRERSIGVEVVKVVEKFWSGKRYEEFKVIKEVR